MKRGMRAEVAAAVVLERLHRGRGWTASNLDEKFLLFHRRLWY
jgi:hypothetical protein